MGIPELTDEQVEELCGTAEKAARGYILSKIPSERISILNITVDTEGSKPVTVNVDVEVTLSPLIRVMTLKNWPMKPRKRPSSLLKHI